MDTPEIRRFMSLRSDFTDFEFFHGDAAQRAIEKERFINNEIYVPRYTYPRLRDFPFNQDVVTLKSSLLEASFGLDGIDYPPELEMQTRYIHSELARIALVDSASFMLSSGKYDISTSAFSRRNSEAYGDLDQELSLSMISTELHRAASLEPRNDYEASVRAELTGLVAIDSTLSKAEKPILNAEEIEALHTAVTGKYARSLSLVPNTDSDIKYGAIECKAILDAVLQDDGLNSAGWRIVVSEDSIIAATYPVRRVIYIPSDISYSADEIRRILVGHEIKAHAWRYENAVASGNQLLEEGTATSADIEEGLGILIECAIAGNLNNPSLDRARDRYITAGLALGVDGTPRDAREVYEVLWRMIYLRDTSKGERASKDVAYGHIENAFRGTSFARKGIIYSKLKIYYEGLLKNAEYFRANINNLDEAFTTAFLGRYNHTDEGERAMFADGIAPSDENM